MIRKIGRRWQADVYDYLGKRHRPTFFSPEEASHWETTAKEFTKEGKPLDNIQAYINAADLTKLGNLYKFVCNSEWSTCRSATGLYRNGEEVCNYFGAEKSVASITSQEIAAWKIALIQKGYAHSTINRKLAALSKILHVAAATDIILKVPAIKKLTEEKTKFRFLDAEEEKRLLTYFDNKGLLDIKDLIIMLLDTGARLNEMLSVRWDSFDEKFQQVTFWHTKTNKPRTVPLTKRAQIIIIKRRQGTRASPFVDFCISKFRSQWNEMRKSLKFYDVTPHTLRHTCCTRLVLGGVDVKRVMEWMGHSTIITTMRYMQLRPTSLEECVHILEQNKCSL